MLQVLETFNSQHWPIEEDERANAFSTRTASAEGTLCFLFDLVSRRRREQSMFRPRHPKSNRALYTNLVVLLQSFRLLQQPGALIDLGASEM